MADVTIFFTGYNQITQGYNRGGYNQDVAFTGLAASGGSVTALAGTIVSVTSPQMTSAVGSVTITGGSGETVDVTSAAMTASAGVINIWQPVVPGQTANWVEIDDSQTPNWTEVAA